MRSVPDQAKSAGNFEAVNTCGRFRLELPHSKREEIKTPFGRRIILYKYTAHGIKSHVRKFKILRFTTRPALLSYSIMGNAVESRNINLTFRFYSPSKTRRNEKQMYFRPTQRCWRKLFVNM